MKVLGWVSAATVLLPVTCLAELTSAAAVSVQQFANTTGVGARVDFTSRLKSADSLPYDSKIPKRELNLYTFSETDGERDYSFDLDTTVLRLTTGDSGHFWIGRTLPFNEGFETLKFSTTDAIGANWTQNQSNPFQPRLAGWLGTGFHFQHLESGIFGTLSFSPFFLPNFGPAVQYSETSPATGPRYSNLPPMTIELNGHSLPLRYRIETGDIKNIVLQPQYFLALGNDSDYHRFTLMHWSAPCPTPHTSTSGILKVNAEDANVLVTAVPDFPREIFFGTQLLFKKAPFEPGLETVFETQTQRLALSAHFQPLKILTAGYLTTFRKNEIAPAADQAPVIRPYDTDLVWFELTGERFLKKIRPHLRVEQHLTAFQKGQWINPRLDYVTDDNLTLSALANIIIGENESYFGSWRSLDSISMGATYSW